MLMFTFQLALMSTITLIVYVYMLKIYNTLYFNEIV